VYSDLYKAWRSEKASSVPQPLPHDFYQRTTIYLKGLAEELASTDVHTIQGRLLVREKEMTERLLDELRKTRLEKILLAAQNRVPIQSGDLTEEEMITVNEIRQSLSSLGQPQRQGRLADELIVVRFLQDIPEIVGVDLRTYGPFKKEDVASLPSANAYALERQGAVRAIEMKSGR
jgi:DNA replication factor GINS